MTEVKTQAKRITAIANVLVVELYTFPQFPVLTFNRENARMRVYDRITYTTTTNQQQYQPY